MKLYELIFPPKCARCGILLTDSSRDLPFCELCLSKWEQEKLRARTENGGLPVREYTDGVPPSERYGMTMYCLYYHPKHRQNVENSLILRIKDHGDRRCIGFAAKQLAELIFEGAPMTALNGSCHSETIVTWIPRRKSSVKKYGFDHMERVAKQTAKLLCMPALPLLRRSSFTKEQKHLGIRERFANAAAAMRVDTQFGVSGKTVILLDDIVTTGASLDAGAGMLIEAGAAQVIAAVLASTDRSLGEKYTITNSFNIIKKPKD